MATYHNLRIAEDVGNRMKPHAQALEWTPNKFAEKCVEIVCAMIENPGQRVLPEIVAMLDARRNILTAPIPLAKSPAPILAAQTPSIAQPRRASAK